MAKDPRSPDEIERDLADTRRHLDATLDALQARMSPGSLFEDALDYARRDGGAFGRNFVETIRDNPVPATLVTIGLGWMMASGRNGGRQQYGALVPAGERQDHPTAAEKLGAAATGTAASARERLHDATDSLRAGRDATTRTAADAAHAVSDTARRGWESTRGAVAGVGQRSRAAGRSMAGFFEENPLAVGVMAVAAGAALAAFLPRSRVEDETLGPLRDRVLEEGRAQVGDLAHEAAERTRVAAHVAAHPEKADLGRSDDDKPAARAAVRPDAPATPSPARPTGAPPTIGSGSTPPPRSP
ncbi:DUF3618 domain-containing protein [Novispirillum sp. DQ9]|uniref:DUF3618 domain-containing protein n=1 Tax=Novispirillum sp. DQ9 TaxID=3398612 RepID=UPI003C7CB7EE